MVLKKKPIKKTKTTDIRIKTFKSKSVKVTGYYDIIFFLILVLIDRLTKIWASTAGNNDYGLIALTYTINTGAGFSILKGMNTVLAVISVVAIAAIIYFHREIPRFSLITIISGIIGNLIDRIFHGGVIDFINLKFWPIFNVADSLIVIGIFFWIIMIILDKDVSKPKK